MQMAQKHDILYVNFYTDGSSARKLASAFPAQQPQRKPKAKKRRKLVVYLDPVAVCSLMVAVVLLIMMAVGMTQFQNARAEAQAMEQYLQQLTQENERLSTQYWEGIDLQEVEKTALALGMVPSQQVQNISIRLSETTIQQPQQNFWNHILTFLTNLFA